MTRYLALIGLASLPVTYEGRSLPFSAYVEEDPLLDGVIVLHRGKSLFEAYPNMQPWQRHYSLVIAWFGTGLNFNEKVTAMKPVVRQLAVSGLFAAPPSDP